MIQQRHCKYCGEPIDLYARLDAIYCSDKCRVRSYRERKETKQENTDTCNKDVTEEQVNLIHEHLYDIENELAVMKQYLDSINRGLGHVIWKNSPR